MSVNINADTTNGLVLTSDTSGELKLQSAGADIATVDSSGITMAAGKTLPASALTGSLPAGMGGKILQVVHANYGTQVITDSTSYIDTGLTATITPSSASNKILVIFNINGTYSNGTTNLYGRVKLLRTSTELMTNVFGQNETTTSAYGSAGGNYLDSPSTTSATTYKVQIKNDAGGGDIGMNTFGATSNITLMEIAG
jgi:hypothetical protein